MTEIRSSSVLPALREDIALTTSDGLTLVGELAVPESGAPRALIITVHPLPTHGGMMDSHVLRKMAARLPALADVAVLRFNTRGTHSARGASEGEYDAGEREGLDLEAAVRFAWDRDLPTPWLLGWSFGTDVILRHALAIAQDYPIAGVLLLSPPLRTTTAADLIRWRDVPFPVIALVPENDDYLPPARALPAFEGVADVIEGPGARHLWTGEPSVSFVLNQVVGEVVPERMPLPTHWNGPMEHWSGL
jgi:alpha/beta superfamily hydrolase